LILVGILLFQSRSKTAEPRSWAFDLVLIFFKLKCRSKPASVFSKTRRTQTKTRTPSTNEIEQALRFLDQKGIFDDKSDIFQDIGRDSRQFLLKILEPKSIVFAPPLTIPNSFQQFGVGLVSHMSVHEDFYNHTVHHIMALLLEILLEIMP